jgi:hypothetical protein
MISKAWGLEMASYPLKRTTVNVSVFIPRETKEYFILVRRLMGGPLFLGLISSNSLFSGLLVTRPWIPDKRNSPLSRAIFCKSFFLTPDTCITINNEPKGKQGQPLPPWKIDPEKIQKRFINMPGPIAKI